jgi:hypothetical protein
MLQKKDLIRMPFGLDLNGNGTEIITSMFRDIGLGQQENTNTGKEVFGREQEEVSSGYPDIGDNIKLALSLSI